MSILLCFCYLLCAAGGAGVVLTREPRQQVLALIANGMALALLFFVLQAPDAAFAELTVGAAAFPLLFVVALSSIRMKQAEPGEVEKP